MSRNPALGFTVEVCSHRTMIRLLRSVWLARMSDPRERVRVRPPEASRCAAATAMAAASAGN